jgi:hypothetical protein
MTISVVKRRRLRNFGLLRIGRPGRAGHSAAAGRGVESKVAVPPPRPSSENNNPRAFPGLHKASAPRLSGPYERLSPTNRKRVLPSGFVTIE